MAASEILNRRQEAEAIEEFLRQRYRDSTHALDQRKFHAIHFYLQDLLWTVSTGYTTHPDNYDLLIAACERLPRVIFITLNYDTLLDDRLSFVAGHGFRSMADYVDVGRSWSLIKLHGSVDWGMPITKVTGRLAVGQWVATNPPSEITVDKKAIRKFDGTSLENLRQIPNVMQGWVYPALSVPVGTRDEFTCPKDHIDFLKRALLDQEEIDVLMLGYSALDEEVLALFRSSGKPLGHVCAVNCDRDAAQTALDRVVQRVGVPLRDGWAAKETFSQFVTGDGLDRFLTMFKRLVSEADAR